MDPAQILWSDTACFAARFEKSAAALVAVDQTLAAKPDASEFRRLFKFIAEASPEHFTQLWRDPAAYYWVRRAVHFLAALHGAPMGRIERAYCADVDAHDPAQALRIHLEEFKRLAMALAILSERELSFAEPYRTALPVALPGTQLVISGSGNIAIHRVAAGHVHATYQGELLELPIADDAGTGAAPHIRSCPLVELGEVRIPLNHAMFRLPGIGLSREWNEPDSDFQRLHSRALSDALAVVAAVQPETFAQFPHALRTIALKPMREGTFSSLSSSELPGAFICSVPCDRYELAATLMHEFYHNRLYAIEETGSFFEQDGEDAVEEENHYSPWRDGPRPLHGLFHALYVYVAVCRYWNALLEERNLDGTQLAFAHDQLARIPFQLSIGINQLRRFAHFTPFGKILFEQLGKETTALNEDTRTPGISLHSPAITLRANGLFQPVHEARGGRPLSVGETLRDHLERRDLQGECLHEKLILDRILASNPSFQ
jgi:HEXXH motif-containing protein